MKTLFGGSAALTALLTASVLFYDAHPLAAQPANLLNTAQQLQQTTELPPAQAIQTERLLAEVAVNAPIFENGDVRPGGMLEEPPPMKALSEMKEAAAPQVYTATAYNLMGRTANGSPVRKGVIAADPRVLPLGTRVRLEAGPYTGEYMVADTGGSVRGRKIDVWVPSSREACRFGRRNVKLTVLTYGGKRKAQETRVKTRK